MRPVGPAHDPANRSYARHIKICDKVFNSKRKAFDTKAARGLVTQAAREGVELAELKTSSRAPGRGRGRGRGGGRGDKGRGGGSNWKAESNKLREAMRAQREYAKAVKSGTVADLPPPVSSEPDPSLVPCPHCGRSFNEKAAERHIPRCSSIKARPTRLKKGGGAGGLNAKSRSRAGTGRGRF